MALEEKTDRTEVAAHGLPIQYRLDHLDLGVAGSIPCLGESEVRSFPPEDGSTVDTDRLCRAGRRSPSNKGIAELRLLCRKTFMAAGYLFLWGVAFVAFPSREEHLSQRAPCQNRAWLIGMDGRHGIAVSRRSPPYGTRGSARGGADSGGIQTEQGAEERAACPALWLAP